MNHTLFFSTIPRGRGVLLCTCLAAFFLLGRAAFAAPGAHGPNGEHLDAPPAQTAGAGSDAPRFESHSETFELVGRLQGGELSLMINRYETNEPVLNAKVEVEAGALKAAAPFHADLGDYAVDDEALLKALAVPGEHPLVITILAGADTDLLDGTLVVAGAAAADGHGHSHEGGHGVSRTVWLALALVVLLAIGWWFGRSRKNPVSPSVGGVQ